MTDKNEDFKEFKFRPILGSLPEMGATDWWTDEQWAEHYAYVEKLKKEGKYLTEGEEITIFYKPNPIFDSPKNFDAQFQNFGILSPKDMLDNQNSGSDKIIKP